MELNHNYMRERDMQTLFGKYIQQNPPKESEVYELKFGAGTSIAFNSIKDHQRDALVNTQSNHLYHKITDQPWIEDRPWVYTIKKPFDCFCLVRVNAFVVVWFYKRLKPKVFIKIPILDFIEMENTCGRKSFTEQMALNIGKPMLIKIK